LNARQDEPVLHVKEERIIKRRSPPRDSLAGTFRVGDREARAMSYLRANNWGILLIADLLGRSLQTIHRFIKGALMDNRRRPAHNTQRISRSYYLLNRGEYRIKFKMYLDGFYNTPKEAMEAKMIPLKVLEYYDDYNLASENTPRSLVHE